MENNFKQWNLDQKRLEFKEAKRVITRNAEDEKYRLTLEYQAACRRVNDKMDAQLYEISKKQAKLEDEYRAFRAEQKANEEGGEQ